MAVSTELAAKQREVIFDDMDAVTQDVALEGQRTFVQGMQVAAVLAWDIGALVDQVYSAEHFNEAQRKREVKKLAAYWNQPEMSPTKLYDLRNVAVTFDREFLQSQVEEPLSNGGYLSWSHFKELQKVGNEKRQLAILKKVRKGSWSSNELSLELASKGESAIKRSGGRKPTLPKTPNAMLQKLYNTVGQSNNYISALAAPLQGIFLEMPAEEVDEQFLESIDETLERIKDTSAQMKTAAAQLKKVRQRTVTVLKSAEGSQPEEASVALAAKQTPGGDVPPIEGKTIPARKSPRRSSKQSE